MKTCPLSRKHFPSTGFISCALVWLCVGAAILPRAACQVRSSRTRSLMGTLMTITAYGPQESIDKRIDDAFSSIRELEKLLSVYDQKSELSRLKQEAVTHPLRVSGDTFRLIKESLRVAELTGGAFDPTVGPLIALWKRSAQEDRLPTREELDKARAQVDFRKVKLEASDSSVRLLPPIASLDLGGIAKGAAAEAACRVLAFKGIKSALADAGGDIFALGTKPEGEPWIVGIQDPFDRGKIMLKLGVSDQAVVTSGNYYRYFEIRGQRYSHIIDPRTGWPADAAPSVTVIAPKGAQADALATAVSVLGVEAGLKLIETLPDTECLFITGNEESYKLIRSSGFETYEMPRDE